MTRLCTTQRWRASADDKELFSDVDTGAANDAVATSGFAAALDGFRFAHNRPVTGEAIAHPERTLFLAEFEVGFRHRFAGVGDHHKLVEFLVWLGHGVTSEQAVAVHRDALAGGELEHKACTGLAARNDPCALDVVEVVGGVVQVDRLGHCGARHNHVSGERAIVACAEVNGGGRLGSELQVRFRRGLGLGFDRAYKLGLGLNFGLSLRFWRGFWFERRFRRDFRIEAGCRFGLNRGLGLGLNHGLGRRNRRCGIGRKWREICDRCKRHGC